MPHLSSTDIGPVEVAVPGVVDDDRRLAVVDVGETSQTRHDIVPRRVGPGEALDLVRGESVAEEPGVHAVDARLDGQASIAAADHEGSPHGRHGLSALRSPPPWVAILVLRRPW